MSKTLLFIALAISIATATVAFSTGSQQPNVKRLDGSTITPAEIDATVTRLMRAAEVTGVSLAILNDGKVSYLKSYGVRDKEKNLPLTPDSVMPGASFTKVAFAYLVMRLVDEKVLDLDRPVSEYLPKPLPEYAEYKDLANEPRCQANHGENPPEPHERFCELAGLRS